jgi:hypothetical protein
MTTRERFDIAQLSNGGGHCVRDFYAEHSWEH